MSKFVIIFISNCTIIGIAGYDLYCDEDAAGYDIALTCARRNKTG